MAVLLAAPSERFVEVRLAAVFVIQCGLWCALYRLIAFLWHRRRPT